MNDPQGMSSLTKIVVGAGCARVKIGDFPSSTEVCHLKLLRCGAVFALATGLDHGRFMALARMIREPHVWDIAGSFPFPSISNHHWKVGKQGPFHGV
jgi:hypothetical protein